MLPLAPCDKSNSLQKYPGAGHRAFSFATAEAYEVPAELAILQASQITFYSLF